MFLYRSIQMPILWMLAIFITFLVFLQNNVNKYDEQVVTLAVSEVFVDGENFGLSKDQATEVARQIAQYIVNKGFRSNSRMLINLASSASPSSTVYLITPTYRRPEQMADLTRLSQTLMLVRDIHWLLVEDADTKSPQLKTMLESSGISYTHLCIRMPENYRTTLHNPYRGIINRNLGLQWIRENANDGVVYFADDDNTYDIRLFDEMRNTQKVSMWPVGLCTYTGVSSPIVKDGKLTGFYDGYLENRKFPVDMAGFAFSVKFLKERPNAIMPHGREQEDGFLKSLAPFEASEIELKADNCTKILVWHTQTKNNAPAIEIDRVKFKDTNIIRLKDIIV